MQDPNLKQWPIRKHLPHSTPSGLVKGAVFFITINCKRRHSQQLTIPEVFSTLKTASLVYEQTHRWYPLAFVAMPDHWHALISFFDNIPLPYVIRDWKRYVAKKAGVLWQDGFFDHRVRGIRALETTWRYMEDNPVRKGLCRSYTEWPWRWQRADAPRCRSIQPQP